eukprot:7152287-Alexandrium_andersonii.AAC.1
MSHGAEGCTQLLDVDVLVCARGLDEGCLPPCRRRPLVERQALVARASLVGLRVKVGDGQLRGHAS